MCVTPYKLLERVIPTRITPIESILPPEKPAEGEAAYPLGQAAQIIGNTKNSFDIGQVAGVYFWICLPHTVTQKSGHNPRSGPKVEYREGRKPKIDLR